MKVLTPPSSSITQHLARFTFHVSSLLPAICSFIGGLALARLLYEGWFPELALLGRPLPVLFAAAFLAVLVWGIRWPYPAWLSWLPLAGNLLYLFTPELDMVRGRVLFLSTLWLTFTLFYLTRPRAPSPSRPLVTLTLFLIPLYLLTLGRTVGQADTFEFQVVAPQLGIAHPTGYPLYLLLGKLWTLLIPIGSVAWRLNVGTAMYGVTAAVLVYGVMARLVNLESGRVEAERLETAHCSLPTPLIGLFTALVLATRPTFWGQTVEAEVYTLHLLIVAAALYLMVSAITTDKINIDRKGHGFLARTFIPSPFILYPSSFIIPLIGLGLTNHLTTVFLIPPALLIFWWQRRQLPWTARWLAQMALAGLLPLLLYAYLPWRWWVVNGEAMGWGRFVDWVVAGRFRGALQLTAFLQDSTRYEIVGRLFHQEWGTVGLVAAAFGLIFLVYYHPRAALLTFITWLGFTLYCLNYHVPDLAVFLLPAHLIIALWIGFALTILAQTPPLANSQTRPLAVLTLCFIFLFTQLPPIYRAVDRSSDDGLITWGEYVLNLPIAAGGMILADSEKIAPLYYLQQAEGWRPDLEIRVEPDEAAYRFQLETALARGQAVYLARFLPGLEGIYHLRSLGPLTEVSRQPLTTLPDDVTYRPQLIQGVDLLGGTLEPLGEGAAAATLYWRTDTPLTQAWYVYTRWANEQYSGPPIPAIGQHPANNYYPTLAWQPGEIVADFHLLPLPILPQTQTMQLQVALAPPFSDPDSLEWHPVADWPLTPPEHLSQARPLRLTIGQAHLTGITGGMRARPQSELSLLFSGQHTGAQPLYIGLQAADGALLAQTRLIEPDRVGDALWQATLVANVPPGQYGLLLWGERCEAGRCERDEAICGWLARPRSHCIIGQVEISGVPLPEGATNYQDLIALLTLELPETVLQPGGILTVNLQWQALAPIPHDYTLFLQVLDSQDQIVGQVDSWPVQGTFPTSQWPPGAVVNDRHQIQLKADLVPGPYRLIVGWYLLATLQRLPVLNADGLPINDALTLPGLVVLE